MTGKKDAKLLVAEDNMINQKVLKLILEREGYSPDFANNGKVAVKKYMEGDYSMIFMDLYMPLMDGFEATRSIRSYESGTDKHIPIIALTASIAEDEHHLCEEYGMDEYMTKPVDRDDLIGAINKWAVRNNRKPFTAGADK